MALTEAQIKLRKVGGSDVATILGLNQFKTEVELYHEKRGTLEVDDLSENTKVEAGNVLEDGIAELAEKHMGRLWGRPVKLRRCNLTLVHPKYDWLTVHIDRDVVGEERGVECKNVGARAARLWGEQFTDDIPRYYLPQPHTYMLVKGYPVWTVAGYFGGDDLRLYEIERSAIWDELIVQRTHEFWENVINGTPPSIDLDAPSAERVLKRLYPGTDGTTVPASADEEHWFSVLREAKALESQYEKAASIAQAHLLAKMKGAGVMAFANDGTLSRKLVSRREYTAKATSYMKVAIRKPKGEETDDE